MKDMIEKLGTTKGPWYSEEDRVFQEEFSTFRIAICSSNIADYSKEVCNANLIAAAPEMLEALISAARLDEAEDYHNPKVITAIEKATGRTWGEIKDLIKEE